MKFGKIFSLIEPQTTKLHGYLPVAAKLNGGGGLQGGAWTSEVASVSRRQTKVTINLQIIFISLLENNKTKKCYVSECNGSPSFPISSSSTKP